ncbi:ABC transporter ATP-binding protein [Nocardia beijingensis]
MNSTVDTPARTSLRDLLAWTKGNRIRLSFAGSAALLAAGLGLLQPMIVNWTIDRAIAKNSVVLFLVLLVAVFLAQAILQAYALFRLDQAGERMILRIRRALVDRLIRVDLAVLAKQRLGDLISRATTDTTLLRDALVYDVVGAAVNGVIIIGGIGMLLWLDPLLAVIVLTLVFAAGFVVAGALKGIRRAVTAAQDSTGALASDLERVLSAVRMVRIHRMEERESDRLAQVAGEIYQHNVRAARLSSAISPAIEMGIHASFVVVIVVGLQRVSGNHMMIGELVAFLLYVNYLSAPMMGILDFGRAMQTGLAALQRVDTVLDLPAETDRRPEENRQCETNLPAETSGLILRNVRFSYGDRPVLRGIDFRVAPCTMVAIVGRSGAGKSTILSLLARFYDPSEGSIMLNGRDAHSEHSLHDWRARVGLVEQDSPSMFGTLRDNICYGTPESAENWLEQVVDMAGLADLVERLPEGLDTPVGEHGTSLSGGERQRVAIARAVFGRPELLLLDEPTAHLDGITEDLIAENLRRLAQGCTVLVVAHRPSTVQAADQIVVIEDGRVAAAGGYADVYDRLPTSVRGEPATIVRT